MVSELWFLPQDALIWFYDIWYFSLKYLISKSSLPFWEIVKPHKYDYKKKIEEHLFHVLCSN